MPFAEYISFVFLGQESSSSHQYITSKTKEYYIDKPRELEIELADFYRSKALDLNNLRPSIIFPFLDFHFEKFPGDKLDFIYMVDDLPLNFQVVGFDFIARHIWIDNHQLKKLLSEWVSEKTNEYKALKALRQNDSRMKCKLNEAAIKNFFMERWVIPNSKGVLIMTESELTHFLEANFAACSGIKPIKKIKTQADDQAQILKPMHEFYKKNKVSAYKAVDFCKILLENFEDFDNYSSPENLRKNFAI